MCPRALREPETLARVGRRRCGTIDQACHGVRRPKPRRATAASTPPIPRVTPLEIRDLLAGDVAHKSWIAEDRRSRAFRRARSTRRAGAQRSVMQQGPQQHELVGLIDLLALESVEYFAGSFDDLSFLGPRSCRGRGESRTSRRGAREPRPGCSPRGTSAPPTAALPLLRSTSGSTPRSPTGRGTPRAAEACRRPRAR